MTRVLVTKMMRPTTTFGVDKDKRRTGESQPVKQKTLRKMKMTKKMKVSKTVKRTVMAKKRVKRTRKKARRKRRSLPLMLLRSTPRKPQSSGDSEGQLDEIPR